MYFRRFHPLAPFIHIPTFRAAATPPTLLFVMCVLGLSAMNTHSGSKFINEAFAAILFRAHKELGHSATTTQTIERRMCSFALGLLTLSLAALSAKNERMAQSQAFYSALIATAQRQGLFSAKEVPLSQLLPESMSSEQRWLAWARVESIKRMTSCLATIDWWYGTYLSSSPMIRPESIQISLPSDDDLFKADSARAWAQVVQAGANLEMPTIRPRGFNFKSGLDAVLHSRPLQAFSTYSLLSIIKHLVCDVFHRQFSPLEVSDTEDHLLPWQSYQQDMRGRSLVSVTVALAQSATSSPRQSDLNVLVLWHNLCMTLGANMHVFELAAGRSGAGPASKALADIAEWAHTASARRACIHAAQTFKLLSHRKISDAIMLNSMLALFNSSLVLGLYVFVAQQESMSSIESEKARFDLDGDIEWTRVGVCGLAEDTATSDAMFDSSSSDPAVQFITSGGPIGLGGSEIETGYLSARRILLDYAHLMDEMGAWKPRTFSRILHIMSDVLEDSPMGD